MSDQVPVEVQNSAMSSHVKHYVYNPSSDHAFAEMVLAGAVTTFFVFCVVFVLLLRAWRLARQNDPNIYIQQERLHLQSITRARPANIEVRRQVDYRGHENAGSGCKPTSIKDLEMLLEQLMPSKDTSRRQADVPLAKADC